jgi:hypothetical protein
MASALAYETPSLQKAWEAFCAHLPTMACIWGLYLLVSSAGIALAWGIQTISTAFLGGGESHATWANFLAQLGQMPYTAVSNMVYVLFFAVPAIYYESGEVVTPNQAFSHLLKDPLRYLLAGVIFFVTMSIGFLFCVLPGIAISFVMPVYVNRIFLTRQSIPDAYASSFQAVYRSSHGWGFVGLQILTGLLVILSAVCTCGLGLLVTLPMSSFYIQNAAHHKGVLR